MQGKDISKGKCIECHGIDFPQKKLPSESPALLELAVNQAVFCCYYKFAKIIIKEKTLVTTVASNGKMHYLNSCQTDLTKLICVDLGKSEFLNINIFNWYKALYSACSGIFPHLDFIRPIRRLTVFCEIFCMRNNNCTYSV